MGYYDNLILWG